jgi:hypothetical protein
MRRIVLIALFALVVSDASAQRRGGIESRPGGFSRGAPRQGRFRGPSFFPYGFGYGDDGYFHDDAGPYYGYPPQPVVFVPQPPPQPIVEPPAREVHPVITDYAPPAPGPSAPSEGETRNFGIVLKDGSVRPAIAVVAGASDDVLHYVDPEERHMRISMNEVDREATRKLNRERKLTLWLPSAPPPTAAPVPNH